ncbi:MAG: QueT transporter family protein [candidate division Zixibacteria bacterium]|nr:QueT transporter family protein [candidate division Zixibacteria bacterium]
MGKLSIRDISTAGVIAAVYVVVSYLLAPISFGVYQIRIAEALTVLPFISRAAIPGLFVGCFLANIFGGNGWVDIVFGSLLTLIAALLTRWIARFADDNTDRLAAVLPLMFLALLPPVLINAFGVAAYLAPIIGTNYWFTVQMIGLGQVVAIYALGLPLLIFLRRRRRSLFR